jgi:catechol 2,3-dioxygenase-like lactoylglutathione lyase family enzyme
VKLKQVNHVGIRTKDREKLERFYVEVLGLTPHPEKRNWLKVGDSNTLIHDPGRQVRSVTLRPDG